jgi:hypothetical protein
MPKAKETLYLTLRCTVNYAKLLGKPVDDYEANQGRGNGKEWKCDFVLGDPLQKGSVADQMARLKKAGIGDKVKQKEDYLDGQPFLPLRHKEKKADGELNDPPNVVDVTGAEWDQRKLIGNGSVVDVKIRVVDYGKGFKKGVYIAAVRVLKLVAYNRTEFDELDPDDPYAMAAAGIDDREPEAGDDEQEEAPPRRRRAPVEEPEEDEPEPEEEAPRRRRRVVEEDEEEAPKPRRRKVVDDEDLDDDVPF